MRYIALLVLLVGCSSEPRQPTDQQLALRAYYSQRCIKEGVDPNDQRALYACMMINYRKDEAAVSRQPVDCYRYAGGVTCY
jgi:hypothetical protein